MQVVGGNKIVVLRVLPDERGDVVAERYDTKLIGASEIERGPGKFGGQAFALKGRGNFGVVKDNAAWEAAVGKECAQVVDLRFKALRFFVICDGDAFEVQVHESPGGFSHVLIPEITERAGRTLINLLDDAIGG